MPRKVEILYGKNKKTKNKKATKQHQKTIFKKKQKYIKKIKIKKY